MSVPPPDPAALGPLAPLIGEWEGDQGSDDAYVWLRETLTVESFKQLFPEAAQLRVDRYELPNLLAFKFVLEGALGGGAARSLRSDNLGKTLASALLRMEIPLS